MYLLMTPAILQPRIQIQHCTIMRQVMHNFYKIWNSYTTTRFLELGIRGPDRGRSLLQACARTSIKYAKMRVPVSLENDNIVMNIAVGFSYDSLN